MLLLSPRSGDVFRVSYELVNEMLFDFGFRLRDDDAVRLATPQSEVGGPDCEALICWPFGSARFLLCGLGHNAVLLCASWHFGHTRRYSLVIRRAEGLDRSHL